MGSSNFSSTHSFCKFKKFGHTVRLMAPKFVIPYRLWGKRGKHDAADAAAICEAITRPNMRFVPIKSVEQQGQLNCSNLIPTDFLPDVIALMQ